MKRSVWLACFHWTMIFPLLLIATPAPCSARIIFSENWDSAAIDETHWTVGCVPGGEWKPIKLADGDYAVCGLAENKGNRPPFASLVSRLVFTRGKSLRVTFKLWGDPTQTLRGGHTFPDRSTLIGPWHRSNYDYCEDFTLEAGLNSAAGRLANDFRWGENGIVKHYATPLPDRAALAKAWSQAVSKDKALTLRVTLGDTTGAFMEWNDGTGWKKSMDTRGQKVTLGGRISSAATVKLGFNPYFMPILIDDIVVEQDSTEADESLKPFLSQRKVGGNTNSR
jgi:hypothetical protein